MIQHKPLQDARQQIRLLKLLWPQEPSEHLELESSVHNIADQPVYNAISYTWGPKLPEAPVILDGNLTILRDDCRHALRSCQERGISEYLWIDYICINQSDDVEKSAQVAIMGSIFHRAATVLVSPRPLPLFSIPADVPEDLRQYYANLKSREQACLDHESTHGPGSSARDVFGALSGGKEMDAQIVSHVMWKLRSSRYWCRLWILQEILQAS
ncbi:hypothetical protein LTR78_001002 [Recurvomyces mirabilis]|uniref:Heterokaryon incompatibility domain-containing protein n=1 Tax=Recurvomyces mirabilis TaxID=574656 RepID=A0AAE0WW44_9PEZI|nr:hypothetical protein LTR78_001002 [Recurvomyces mirabilis]KAK5158974.1 hypothetical protein LTS14_003082 [Recurvomyces mirabilis]